MEVRVLFEKTAFKELTNECIRYDLILIASQETKLHGSGAVELDVLLKWGRKQEVWNRFPN